MATGFGFKLHRASSASQPLVRWVKLVGDTVRLGIGDPVKKVTGSIKVGQGPTVQACARAASGDRVAGVVVGVEKHTVASSMNLNQRHSPASTAEYILVRPVTADDEYEVQEDGLVTPVPSTSVGNNADFIAADCSTTTGMSGYMLNSDTAATTSTLDLKIVGFVQQPDNLANIGTSTGAKLIVKFNKIENVDQATGV